MNVVLNFLKQRWVFWPLLVGILFSLAANYFNWDRTAQSCFYDGGADHWTGRDITLMVFLYKYSPLPALAIGFSALVGLIAGYFIPNLNSLRKVCFYFFSVLVVGNGILANALLKGFWGRPRPSQLKEFGGTQIFEPSLWIDLASFGKSFPCGHATMGFYFFAIALLLKGKLRGFFVTLALAFGALIGISRMSYGGHFLTDVVWAAILMWLVAFGLFQALHLKDSWRFVERAPKNRAEAIRRKLIRFALIPLVIISLALVATRSPRDKTHQLILAPSNQEVRLELDLRGVLKIETESKALQITTRAQGFGFPKSKLNLKSEIDSESGSTKIEHDLIGFFSDLRATTQLKLPAGHRYRIQLKTDRLQGLRLNDSVLETTPELMIDLRAQP